MANNDGMDTCPTTKKKRGATEFTCEVCGKVYKTKKYFKNHIETHSTQAVAAESVDQPSVSESLQPKIVGGSSIDNADYELPPDYVWDEWPEENIQEVPTYFEIEDEEEEARRTGETITTTNASKKQTRNKGYLVKCHECASKFNTLDNFIKHRAGHGMKAAYMNAPTMDKIVESSSELCKPVLEDLEGCPLTGGHAPMIASIASRLKLKIDSPVMPSFFKTLCDCLLTKFLKKKDFLSPSQLTVTFLRETSLSISNFSERETLQELLCDVLGVKEEVSVLHMFLGLFMRKFSDKVLVFILRTIRLGDGSAEVHNIRGRYVKSSQSTDTNDFVQNVHYIGGSNIKSVFRTAMKENTPEWRRVVITLRRNFLVSDFACAPPQLLSAWTDTRDRGGLQKISKNALDFFVLLANEVKVLERLDGSLLNEEVFDVIGQSAPLLCMWDELKGNLSDTESCKLLHALVSHFCYTWRNGILGRRQDSMAMKKSEKHGTGGVAFRPRLVGTGTSNRENAKSKEIVKKK